LVMQLKTDWQKLSDLYDQIRAGNLYPPVPDPFTYLYNNIFKNITLNQLAYQQDILGTVAYNSEMTGGVLALTSGENINFGQSDDSFKN